MSGRVFVDTNVFVYLFDRDAPEKRLRAQELLEQEHAHVVLSTQVLQEFFVTVTRKLAQPLSTAEAEAAAREMATLEVVEVDSAMVLRALSRLRRQRASLWDSLIVEAALSRGCERLLSEDMQHGQEIGTLRIENPFR